MIRLRQKVLSASLQKRPTTSTTMTHKTGMMVEYRLSLEAPVPIHKVGPRLVTQIPQVEMLPLVRSQPARTPRVRNLAVRIRMVAMLGLEQKVRPRRAQKLKLGMARRVRMVQLPNAQRVFGICPVRIAAFLLLVFWPTEALAKSLWEHNGSIVYLEAEGQLRRFYYDRPRSELPVEPGTPLFHGQTRGNRYVGTAYVFSDSCGPIGYPVAGVISANKLKIRMRGKAPVRDADCNIIRFRDDELVFTYQRTVVDSVESKEVGDPTDGKPVGAPME